MTVEIFTSRTGVLSVLLAALMLCLTGCAKMPLFANIDEREANEMAAILMTQGVECIKTPGDDGTWNLEVSPDDFEYSLSVLKAQGFPRPNFQKMSEVFPKGTFSSPVEDHYRYVDLREQQLSRAILANFPEVISADVKISLPQSDPLEAEPPETKASLIVRHRPDFDFEMIESDLKSVVANTVDGLDASNVEILAKPSELTMPPMRPVEESDLMARLSSLSPLTLAGISAGTGALLAAILVGVMFRRKPAPASASS